MLARSSTAPTVLTAPLNSSGRRRSSFGESAIASAAASASRVASTGSPEYRSVIRSKVSSSSAASFVGDHDVTAAGPRMTKGVF